MPLTRDFRETVMERMRSNPVFRVLMLREGIDALLGAELEVGKEVLRDYVNATMGFDGLAKQVGIPPKSLMRMLGPSGNPQASNLFAIIGALQRDAGVELHIADVQPKAAKRPKRAAKARNPRADTIRYPVAARETRAGFEEPRTKFRRS